MIRADKILLPAERLKMILDAEKISYEREFQFAKPMGRKFRADFRLIGTNILLEVEGGVYARQDAKRCPYCKATPVGRHVTGKGFENDLQKYNLAALLGYIVLRFSGTTIDNGNALDTIKSALRKQALKLTLEGGIKIDNAIAGNRTTANLRKH